MPRRMAGTYCFSVHHFNERASTTSGSLSKSQAQVRVSIGTSSTPVIFTVPPARPGTLWMVFEMDDATGVITPLNSLTFVHDPATIQ